MIRENGWYWYLSGEEDKLERHKCGKWMYFFDNQKFAQKICEKAIAEKICYECKCTDMEKQNTSNGVVCFYTNGDNTDNHKRIIKFMLENDLIRKTKAGKYYNITFKYDDQTRAGEYGSNFEGKINIEKFIDLKTGILKK